MRSHRESVGSEKNEGPCQNTNNLGTDGEKRRQNGYFEEGEKLRKYGSTETKSV